MSGLGLSLEVRGPDLSRLLREAGRQLGNARPALLDVGEYLLRETHERFRNESDPDGHPWQPLSDDTIAAKGHDSILQDSGRLMNSLTYRASSVSLALGTNVVYAPIHQFGGVVMRPERQGTLRFKADAKGNMLSQGSFGKTFRNANKMRVFAKEGAKRVIEQAFTAKASSFGVPARPFLGINGGDRREIARILQAWIESRFPTR